MRYYKIQLPQRIEFNSFPNGSTDPGALNVEMDVQIGPMHTPFGASWLRVWNIPLNLIAQANDFNPSAATSTSLQTITVFGGMQKGLPLAVPAQSGLLFQGGIYQAFGNWQGTDQTLEFRITQSPYSADAPGPFAFTWKKGQNLSALIKSVLSIAFPNYTAPIIKISDALVTNQDQAFYYENLPQFAKWINLVSKAIVTTSNYPGVGISLKPNQAIVLDGTTQTPATKILFTDLIGQMTWIGPQVLNMKTVMRADLSVGDYVTLPPGQIATTAASLSSFRQGSVFTGLFRIVEIRHVGNYRDPSADSWCSVFTLQGPYAQAQT